MNSQLQQRDTYHQKLGTHASCNNPFWRTEFNVLCPKIGHFGHILLIQSLGLW